MQLRLLHFSAHAYTGNTIGMFSLLAYSFVVSM